MNAPALPADPEAVVSVEELDARIDAHLTLLAQIDAQRADRGAAAESGDLDASDYRGWLVRALDKRKHTVDALVSLRHARHTAAQAEASARTEVARLRLALQRAHAENEALRAAPRGPVQVVCTEGTARQQKRIEDLNGEVAGLRGQLMALGANPAPDGASAPVRMRDAMWRAFLDGEVAVLHPDRAAHFLAATRRAVPREFRDARVAREIAEGYPAPRTSAQCDAEAAAQKAALTAEQRA